MLSISDNRKLFMWIYENIGKLWVTLHVLLASHKSNSQISWNFTTSCYIGTQYWNQTRGTSCRKKRNLLIYVYGATQWHWRHRHTNITYQRKNGSQHRRKTPMMMPRVRAALCSARHPFVGLVEHAPVKGREEERKKNCWKSLWNMYGNRKSVIIYIMECIDSGQETFFEFSFSFRFYKNARCI